GLQLDRALRDKLSPNLIRAVRAAVSTAMAGLTVATGTTQPWRTADRPTFADCGGILLVAAAQCVAAIGGNEDEVSRSMDNVITRSDSGYGQTLPGNRRQAARW